MMGIIDWIDDKRDGSFESNWQFNGNSGSRFYRRESNHLVVILGGESGARIGRAVEVGTGDVKEKICLRQHCGVE